MSPRIGLQALLPRLDMRAHSPGCARFQSLCFSGDGGPSYAQQGDFTKPVTRLVIRWVFVGTGRLAHRVAGAYRPPLPVADKVCFCDLQPAFLTTIVCFTAGAGL